jgi:hypothetical protein
LRGLRRGLERDRALPGDDVAIVATRRRAARPRRGRADLFAIFAPAIVKNDARPETLRVRSSCGVPAHDDGRRVLTSRAAAATPWRAIATTPLRGARRL